MVKTLGPDAIFPAVNVHVLHMPSVPSCRGPASIVCASTAAEASATASQTLGSTAAELGATIPTDLHDRPAAEVGISWWSHCCQLSTAKAGLPTAKCVSVKRTITGPAGQKPGVAACELLKSIHVCQSIVCCALLNGGYNKQTCAIEGLAHSTIA